MSATLLQRRRQRRPRQEGLERYCSPVERRGHSRPRLQRSRSPDASKRSSGYTVRRIANASTGRARMRAYFSVPHGHQVVDLAPTSR